MDRIRIVYCPVCKGVAVMRPGLPPGQGLDYTNRCQNGMLTGSVNWGNSHRYRRSLSWRFPQRSQTWPCLAPLTDRWGWPIQSALTFEQHKEIVRNEFNPRWHRAVALGTIPLEDEPEP